MNKHIQWYKKAPYNSQYDDIYYSSENGLAESEHVFIRGNQLAARWKNLKAGERFTIFEAGFGSGLNFLAAWSLWQELQPKGELMFISCENNPFNKKQYQRALEPFAESLSDFIASFLRIISVATEKTNHYVFSNQVQLTILNCDIQSLSSLLPENSNINAIFLDGFSPAKNPDMWSQALCQTLYEQSTVDCTVATFTVAGFVKRNLTKAGFVIQKVPGYGKKREMLYAYKAAK